MWSWLAALAAAAAVVAVVIAFGHSRPDSLVTIVHLPEVYPRRGAALSANVTAHVAHTVQSVRYRVNDHPWHRIDDLWHFRFVGRVTSFEMPVEELQPGLNRVEIIARAPWRDEERHELSFHYDPAPVKLPVHRVWKGEEIEAQDGAWEVIEVDGEARVRVKPGYEGYDRLLLATGAFPVPRRIETYAVYRYPRLTGRKEVGFGVLALWGGHPGEWSRLPRSGWTFMMGMYWSKQGGVGIEMSHYDGSSPPRWLNSYRGTPLVEGGRYNIVIEVDDEREDGKHQFYRIRVKIWLEGEPEPSEWTVATDKEGSPLPEAEYAVALFALDCQVEFGPLTVTPLAAADESAAPP